MRAKKTHKKLITFVLLASIVTALAACQADPNITPNPPIDNPEPQPEPALPLFVPSADTDPCLALVLQTPDQTSGGQGVTGTLGVTNTCNEPVERLLGALIMYVLKDEHVVWDSTDDLPPPGSLEFVDFGPNETRAYTLEWDGVGNGDETTSEGSYEVVVRLEVTGPAESDRFLNLDSNVENLLIN